jgi:hypothetical protein
MKKILCFLLSGSISLFSFTSCEKKIDIEKEKQAIKAVFEQEKAAFIKQDLTGLGDTWVKDQSSVKIFMGANGQTKLSGWDNINERARQEISDTSLNRQMTKLDILNYQIDVIGDCAWVLCDYHWEAIISGVSTILDQSRICVLKKVDNKWKFVLMSMFNMPVR